MNKRYYLAYGSNLNLKQMERRCPDSKRVGSSFIDGYRLLFKGSASGNYLTIEKAAGHQVPVGVFAISNRDEDNLDMYEGFPYFYYKKDFVVNLDGEMVEAFAYIMHEDRELGMPSDTYVKTVKEGYALFGFDAALIEEAIETSKKKTK